MKFNFFLLYFLSGIVFASANIENFLGNSNNVRSLAVDIDRLKSGDLKLKEFIRKQCFYHEEKSYLASYIRNRVEGAYLRSFEENSNCFLHNLSKINFYFYETDDGTDWLIELLSELQRESVFIELELAILELLNGDYETAFSKFEHLSTLEVHEASYYLAVMYDNGIGVEESSLRAKKYLELASDAGHYNAKLDLLRKGFDNNDPELQELNKRDLIKLASKGHFDSAVFLSVMRLTGNTIQQDIELAISDLEDLPFDPRGEVEYYLGLAKVLVGNLEQGVSLINLSADKGNKKAISYLTDIYAQSEDKKS